MTHWIIQGVDFFRQDKVLAMVSKKSIMILLPWMILLGIFISGCSNDSRNQHFAPENNGARGLYNQSNRTANLTTGERQSLIEAIQRVALNACQGRSEGEPCALQGKSGNISGTCKTQGDKLMCSIERGGMQRPNGN